MTLDRDALLKAYDSCGIKSGSVVYVTGNIGRIGLLKGTPNPKKDTLALLRDTLLSQIGPEGTLVFPTHSWSIKALNIPYCKKTTSSDYLLSEFLRTTLSCVRTNHHLASIAAHGTKADKIINAPNKRSPYGPYSPFEELGKQGAIHLALGMPVQLSISAVHHCEQMAGVPYRYMKEFPYPTKTSDGVKTRINHLYVTYLNSDLTRDRNRKIFQIPENKNAMRCHPLGRSQASAIDLGIFIPATTSAMLEDPYIWLERLPQKRPWQNFANGLKHAIPRSAISTYPPEPIPSA